MLFLFFFLLFEPELLFSQTDYEFWFAPPEVTYEFVAPSPYAGQNLNQPIKLIFTTNEGPASVVISQPANPLFFPISITVQNSAATEVNLTPFIEQVETKPANTILSTGVKITSSNRVNVTYEIQNGVNSETFTLKGRNALGYEFIVPSQNVFPNYEYCNPPARNSITIVATEDSTTVEVIPTNDIEGHMAYDTAEILLNRGQTWCARAVNGDSTDHLGGSFVFASKPIAITVKDDALHPVNFNFTENSIDLAGDQLIPRHLSGEKFFTINTAYQPSGEIWLFVYAYEDHTEVNLAGMNIGVLNRGGFLRRKLNADTITCNSFLLESTKPVSAFELNLSASTLMGQTWGQTASTVLPPIECAGSKMVTFADTPPYCPPPPPVQISDAFKVTVITKSWNIGNITLQQGPYGPSFINIYCPVPGTNGEWVVGNVQFSGNTPVLVSSSSGKFHVCTQHYFASAYNRLSYCSNFASLNLGPYRLTCPGESVILDAGNGWQTCLWNTGDTTPTLTVNLPGVYWVQVSGDSCQLSDTVVISHYWSQPVNLGENRQICSGDSIQLNAGPGRTWYSWSTGETTQSIWVKNTGIYWVRVPDVHCIVSDTIQVVTTPVPSITNFPLSKTICSGESTSIQLTANVQGVMFHWTASLASGIVTGFTADSGLVINQTLINTGTTSGVVTYHITPKVGECVGTTVDFPVTVTPGNPVGVSITSSANNICAGTSVTFTATAVNPGSNPTYQWKVNAINAVNANNAVYSYIPLNGDVVQCVLSSSNTICTSNNPATSNAIVMVVNPVLPVSVTVSPSVNPVCAGTSVVFTATVLNGGAMPVYQWKVNGNNAGTNSSTFTRVPANGDQITVLCTSSFALCTSNNPATSAPVTMVVNATLPAGISIVASANPFCPGSAVTFIATAINGGAMPMYQWKVNSVNAINGNNAVFSYVPANGDSVTCQMTSNLSCVTGNPATSARITMNGSLAPNVAFSVCFDTITTVNAKPFKLKGGLPLGGTYSGPGVNSTSGIFTPSIAGVGNYLITYTYTNTHGCSSAKQSLIHSFTHSLIPCGSNLTDIRDGKVYPTVQIGSQCWMQKNLEFGAIIPTTIPQTDNCIAERYSSFVTSHSSFYQWDELMQYQTVEGSKGLCPPGWHVPSEADWFILFNYYQGNSRAGRPLQDTIINGFKALMSGVLYSQTFPNYEDFATLLWSSTPSGSERALAHGMNKWNYSVSLYPALRANAFATRCLRD